MNTCTCFGNAALMHSCPKCNPLPTPPQSDPALAAAEAIVYHNPDRLPSPGEAPWRFLVKGEKPDNGDEQWSLFGVWNPAHTIVPELRTFRTRRPLPLAPAPAPWPLPPQRSLTAEERESLDEFVQGELSSTSAPAPEGRGETAECDAAKVDAGYIIASHSNGEFVPFAIAEKLEHERNQWKANHDCQLKRKQKVSAMLSETIAARDAALARVRELEAAIAERVAAKEEYDSNSGVTCLRCGEADKQLKRVLAAAARDAGTGEEGQ